MVSSRRGCRWRTVGARLASACSRLARLTMPTSLLAAHHRQTLDPVLLHELHDVFECGVLGDGVRLGSHHVRDLAGVSVDIFVRQRPGPTRNSSHRGRCRSVAVSAGAGNRLRSRCRRDRPSASTTGRPLILLSQHRTHGLKNAGAWLDRQNLARHDVLDFHRSSPYRFRN